MSLFRRLLFNFKALFSKQVDKLENPMVTLDYSYDQLRVQQVKFRQALVEFTTEQKSLEATARSLEGDVAKAEQGAKLFLTKGDEASARKMLERKVGIQSSLESTRGQLEELNTRGEIMRRQSAELDERLRRFATEKETEKALYQAAKASAQVGEITTGIGEGAAEATQAIERAREKRKKLEARAGAINSLMADGTLTDQLTGESAIDHELASLASNAAVESELDRLKADMGQGAAPPQAAVEAGDALQALESGERAIPDVTQSEPVAAPEKNDA
jgi:phage shock protein A